MKKLALATLGCMLVLPGYGLSDLWQIFQIANQNGASIQAEEKTSAASLNAFRSSAAGLFPQVSTSAVFSDENSQGEESGTFRTETYSASLSQVVFSPYQWMSVVSGYHTARSARSSYFYEYQQFIQTVIEDYFAVLKAEDVLRVDQANVSDLNSAYIQALAQYKVGISTVTAVKQAEAGYRQAEATEIQDENALQSAKQNLQAITNVPVTELLPLQEDLVWHLPQPANVAGWLQLALVNNQNLQASEEATKSGKAALESRVGDWLPVVSLEASITDPHSDANQTIFPEQNNEIDRKVELNLSWNLFTGPGSSDALGANPSSIQQGANLYEADRETQEQIYRNTQMAVKQDFNQAQADLSNITQYQAAVVAGQAALLQYQARFKVGMATMTEVLQQVDDLYQDEQEYLSSQYSFINDVVQLKLDAGVLDVRDLQSLNHLLG